MEVLRGVKPLVVVKLVSDPSLVVRRVFVSAQDLDSEIAAVDLAGEPIGVGFDDSAVGRCASVVLNRTIVRPSGQVQEAA